MRKIFASLIFVCAASVAFAQTSRAEEVMHALAQAYPDRVGEAAYRDGDWAVRVGDKWYYYADGRILPESLLAQAEQYDRQPFYQYAAVLPPWKMPTAEESARAKNAAGARRAHPPKRSTHFYDDLWRAHTKDESYARIKTIFFLGHKVSVHYAIMEELALVEERIYAVAKKDPSVQQWLSRISSVSAWNWRSIADTESRSYHAYGAAVDIQVPAQRGKESYWLWAAERTDWWTVPYTNRLHPPDAVVKAFESYGFVWGGKWLFYDTMHFEYRPEILLLSGLPVTGLD